MLEVYSADWCNPCQTLKKLLDKENIKYKAINIDEEPELANHNGIRGIPTLINSETNQRLVGAVTLEQVKSIV